MRAMFCRLSIFLLIAVLGRGVALAGTYTITVGSGTLMYTATVTNKTCMIQPPIRLNNGGESERANTLNTYYLTVYSGFSYTLSGTATPLAGTDNTLTNNDDLQDGGCGPASRYPQITLQGPTFQIVFTPSGTTGGSGVYTPGTTGSINPKYKIVGVQYAPPGSMSNVTYGDNTVVGSSTSVASSFSTQVASSISITGGVNIFGLLNGQQTTTYSSSYSQEEDSSSSIAVTQTTSASTGLSGYSDPVNGVNHDYDYIFLWLNPVAQFVLFPNQVVWTGYGYDLADTEAYPDIDVEGVQLGCLNGDFYQQYINGTNTNWTTCEAIFNAPLSRSWAASNVDGSSPALTPTLANSSPPYDFCQQTGTDLYNVCQADPFSNSNYVTQNFPPPLGSYTTTDGRFTACHSTGCNTTIDYEPNLTFMYAQGYSTTLTQSQGYKDTYQLGYSTETKGGFLTSFQLDLKNSVTFTWVDQFSQGTNNSTGQSASFKIVGPAEGYSGPTQFVVYQDNLYGTFVFIP